MKALFATAGGLALLASGALANPVTEASDTVTLNAVVQDYIAITNTSDSTLTVADVTAGSGVNGNNNDTNENKEDKALFTVIANVEYDIVLDWETWDDAGYTNPTSGYSQANYYNDGAKCSIGGGIKLDPDPEGGAHDNDALPGGGTGTMTYDQGVPTFGHEYGIGTEASPNITTCDGDIAAPGTYSLEVAITVSKADT
ncbi:hypothetical protein [Rhodosalinus sp.]|uniref:hypothetical protein n=1 Tax=Rhodosalinus sp. TaxID=2047741 RepID=UPI00397B84BC